MKKMTICVLGVMMAVSMAACGSKEKAAKEQIIGGDPATWGPTEEANVQIPNPFQNCETLKDATDLAGFDMTVPESIQGYEERSIQAEEKGMIQVSYASEEKQVLIRKAAGSENISGDYNIYDDVETVVSGDILVTVKGNDGKAFLATWTSGENTFSVAVSDGASQDVIMEIVKAVR